MPKLLPMDGTVRRRLGLIIPVALALHAAPGSAQQSESIEPTTGLPWRVIYEIRTEPYNGSNRHRIEYYENRVEVADLNAAADRICAHNDPARRAVISLQQQRDRSSSQRYLFTRYLYVSCQ
ncbi:hypothetical protein [Tabrizicola sp.]|uniref:hypothetical protein n=1 Tax=Tabrizicola sp. TaxID=2005166 RepID=UPI001A3D726C|nr:hypothetical protein [Tabrizicola sp.]MBL9072091.1 hypothetical protein [Tabrizicola sp.]